MKVSGAIIYCTNYHKINSRPNTQANYKFLLGKFGSKYGERHIDSISTDEIIAFLAEITAGRKQNSKRSKYTSTSALFTYNVGIILNE